MTPAGFFALIRGREKSESTNFFKNRPLLRFAGARSIIGSHNSNASNFVHTATKPCFDYAMKYSRVRVQRQYKRRYLSTLSKPKQHATEEGSSRSSQLQPSFTRPQTWITVSSVSYPTSALTLQATTGENIATKAQTISVCRRSEGRRGVFSPPTSMHVEQK